MAPKTWYTHKKMYFQLKTVLCKHALRSMKICMHVYSPEPAENNLHVPHAASSCGAASLGLSAPVVYKQKQSLHFTHMKT